MNDTDNTQDRGLTTEQIAAAGTWTGQEDVPQPTGRESFQEAIPRPAAPETFDDDNAGPIAAGPAASGHGVRSAPNAADGDSVAAGPGPRASLLEDGELRSITTRWKDIQAEFVDEPEQAVQEADALVAELMQRHIGRGVVQPSGS
jgi:hypothetical protein